MQKKRYIEKYGVDPTNQKVVVVNGVPIPKEYAKELVKSGKIKPADSNDVVQSSSVGILATGPQQVNGVVYVHIFTARDDAYGHAPDTGSSYISATQAALGRFETNFYVNMAETWYFGWWDLSDVGSDTAAALQDLVDDCGWVQDHMNDIVFGWADNLQNNGMARLNGWFAVGSEDVPYIWNWPEDSVVQHEISHNFNAPDRGTWYWEHPECIMNYNWAYWGTDIWCSTDWNIVFNNIQGYSD